MVQWTAHEGRRTLERSEAQGESQWRRSLVRERGAGLRMRKLREVARKRGPRVAKRVDTIYMESTSCGEMKTERDTNV